jgi:class 3 adenylate cyclase
MADLPRDNPMSISYIAPSQGERLRVPGAREWQIRTDRAGKTVRFADVRLGEWLGIDPAGCEGGPLERLDVLPGAAGLLQQMAAEALETAGRTVVRTHAWTPEGGPERHLEIRATATLTGVVLLLSDETQRRRLEAWFGRYASNALLTQLLAHPQDFAQPREVEATLLFCDLVNYSGSVAALPPEQVGRLLNAFFRVGIRVVESHRGMIVQFVGDELMVVFGAPLPSERHALDAARCASDLLRAHEAVQTAWRAQGLPALGVRIGLATGRALAGNLGDERRAAWCVVGHPTNVAARMLAAADPGQALASASVAAAIAALPAVANEPPRPRFEPLPEPILAKNMGPLPACRLLSPGA